MYKRNAIALMVTLFFIMLISVVLGLSLQYLNKATSEIEKERFMLQTSVVLDDVLNILKKSAELDAIVEDGSKETLKIFLSQASFIPLEIEGMKIMISLKSARSKININNLLDANNSLIVDRAQSLERYLGYYNVNSDYINMIVDNMSKFKEDMSYNSAIFNENPDLFRDYISSKEHLERINSFYAQSYNENTLSKIDFDALFYYSKESAYKVDANYANAEVWRLLTACDLQKARELSLGGGSYEQVEDLNLNEEEREALQSSFALSYTPQYYLDVEVDISQDPLNAKIKFEYDMKTKKGSNFVYQI